MDRLRQLWYSLPLKIRDIVARANKTFAQVFFTSLPTITVLTSLDAPALKAAVLSSLAAAASAVWNTWKTPPSGETVLVPIRVPLDNLLPPE